MKKKLFEKIIKGNFKIIMDGGEPRSYFSKKTFSEFFLIEE